METEAAELIAKLSLENARFRKQLKEARDKLKEFGDQAEESGEQTSEAFKKSEKDAGQFGKAMKSLKGMIGAAFAAETIIQFGKNIINTTAEFQKMEAVLTNTLGSKSAAQAAMNQITDFASQTPFAVQELTDSFVKLANRGFVPTTSQLRSLGDLASSTGKSFDQLTEAALDAMTGEFERLKEFGIRATAEGDRVQFTFKGVTTEVQKTDAAIKDYILSLGNAEGVTGAMALISETTGGKISNLGDNFTQLFKVIGDSSSGLIAGVLDLSNAIVHHLVRSIDSVNTIAQKTGQGGFKSFLQTLYSLVDPVYATQLEMVATGIKAIEGASFEAMMAGRSFFEQEGKERTKAFEANQKLIQSEKERQKLAAENFKKLKELQTKELAPISISANLDKKRFNEFKSFSKKFSESITKPALLNITDKGITAELIEKLRIAKEEQRQFNKEMETANTITTLLGNTFQSAFEGMLNTGKVSFKGIIEGLKALLVKLLATAAAAFALSAILGGVGLGSFSLSGGGFMKGFKELFSSMSGIKLAKGGLVTGLTTAVLGDNPSGKEAVIPFERMGSFLSQFGTGNSNMRVEVVGRLSGQDIYFSGLNYSNSQNKIISG
jgi:hypothetical protein